MVTQTLPGRLDALISLVSEHAVSVADIGYDHGYALVRLARALPAARLCGVEKIPNAADRFMAAHGTFSRHRIRLFEGDGFQPILDWDLDAALLAGMGEATLLTIAQQHPSLRRRVQSLIVCTPQMPALVRPAFAELGYGVRAEQIAFDGNRFYEAIAFDRDTRPSDDPLELLFGRQLLSLPAAKTYLADKKKRWSRLLDHHGSALVPPEAWPRTAPESAGEFQRIKARALDEAVRRVSH